MDVPSATSGASTAAVVYSEQLEKLNALQLLTEAATANSGLRSSQPLRAQ